MESVLERLRAYLLLNRVEFRELEHEETFTSEDSARARGEPLHIGGKALLMKVGEDFRQFVIPADRKLDSSAVKKLFGVKKMRFATREELLELTGLVPGSVPPFGQPIFELPLVVDIAIQQNDRIAFNAGSLTTSFIVPMAEYIRFANPTFEQISKLA